LYRKCGVPNSNAESTERSPPAHTQMLDGIRVTIENNS
jgi:hypothetical protein